MTELDALIEAVGLKALDRAGWARKGVPGPESVAAHSWGVAWLVLLYLPEGLDRGRALTYATLHDLAEVRTGDFTPADAITADEKRRREAVAMRALSAAAPRGDALLDAFDRYEHQADAEARFVKQLDRVDMAIQAVAYAEAGAGGMHEFLTSAERFVTDPALVGLLERLRARLSGSGPA